MKKLLIVLLITISCLIFAQDVESKEGFGMGGAVGSITMNGNTYSQVRLMPELTLGKFGVGLDIDLLIDSEGGIYKEDWDEWQDYVAKVLYLRYGHRGDKVYGRFGSFPSYTLTHGLIMDNYSNMLEYPNNRQLGLQFGFNTNFYGLGAEVFTPNVAENDIFAARVHAKPLSMTDIPLFSSLEFGVSYVMDTDQYNGITNDEKDMIDFDSDGDGYLDSEDADPDGDGTMTVDNLQNAGFTQNVIDFFIDNDMIDDKEELKSLATEEKELTIIGADYNLPIIKSDLLKVDHYGEAAQIVDYGMGFIFPGFYSKFLIFEANLEFRHFEDEFLPGYFDNLYESQRASIVQNDNGEYVVETKDSILKAVKASSGWYGALKADLFKFVFMKIAYQDMYGDDVETGKSIWGDVWLNTKNIPMIKIAKVSYMQTNVDQISDFRTEQALLDAKVGYAMSEQTVLVYKYQERYIDANGNNKIDSNKSEVIKTVGFGVEFKF